MFTLVHYFRYRILIRTDSYRREPVRTGRNPCSGTDAEEQPVCQHTAGRIAHTHHVDTLSEYPPAGRPEELLPLMRPYFIVLLISLLFVLLFNGFKQFADGITDTRVSMWILLAGNVMNIIGNYTLIFGKFGLPAMGAEGAAISTSIARGVSMIVLFVILFRKHIPSFPMALFRPFPWIELKNLLKVGVPSAGENMSYSFRRWSLPI